ncbi:MAG: hypothetical protein HS100_18900 [Anaerolineales bacterium]|nr:hypothetical protein [Anaerolineales bacterium]
MNYTDPSGHICVESDGDSDAGMAGNCHGGSNPKYKPGLQGPKWNPKSGNVNGGGNVDGGGNGTPELPFVGLPPIIAPDFANSMTLEIEETLSIPIYACPEQGCSPYRPYKTVFDPARIDSTKLAWEYVGLVLSVVGIESIRNAIKLGREIVVYSTIEHTGLSLLKSSQEGDIKGTLVTTAGIHPAFSIAASTYSVIDEISNGYYRVPQLLAGPPTGPYCDTYYGC